MSVHVLNRVLILALLRRGPKDPLVHAQFADPLLGVDPLLDEVLVGLVPEVARGDVILPHLPRGLRLCL